MTFPIVVTARAADRSTAVYALFGQALMLTPGRPPVLIDADRRTSTRPAPGNVERRRQPARPIDPTPNDGPAVPIADGSAISALIGQQIVVARVDEHGLLEVSCADGTEITTRGSQAERHWQLSTPRYDLIAPSTGGLIVHRHHPTGPPPHGNHSVGAP